VRALRINSLGICGMLLAETSLGLGVNLFVKVPDADSHHGLATAIGRALTSEPVALAVHADLGLAMLVAGVAVLTRAILARHRVSIAASAVGLAAIIGAAFSGTNFVSGGQDGSSMVMGTLALAALLCYCVNLFTVVPRTS
jgi:hypothetical protein